MIPPRRHPERGLTLTELTVAMVMAALVVMGIVGFYMNSQALWFDASAMAITQREGSLVLQTIGRAARQASDATVSLPDGDPNHAQLQLQMPDSSGTHPWYFWWGPDSLIHEGPDTGAGDLGPIIQQSKVERFVVVADSEKVQIRVLQMVSAAHQRLSFSTLFAMENR